MERLIKSQYWTLAWITLACLGLMILVLPRLPDFSFKTPLAVIVLGEWIFAFAVSVILQLPALRQSSANLRFEPACQSLAIMFFASGLAVIFSPAAQLSPDWAASIGVGQMAITTLGILLLILAIEHIQRSGQPQEVNKNKLRQRVNNAEEKVSKPPKSFGGFKLEFLAGKSSPPSEPAPDSASPRKLRKTGRGTETSDLPVPSDANPSTSKINLPQSPSPDMVKPDSKKAVQDDPRAEIRRLPSAKQNKSASKIIDPNKPVSSTITKLQALSASGIGSIHQSGAPADSGHVSYPGQAPELGLRSVLNRQEGSPQEQKTIEDFIEIAANEENFSTEPIPEAFEHSPQATESPPEAFEFSPQAAEQPAPETFEFSAQSAEQSSPETFEFGAQSAEQPSPEAFEFSPEPTEQPSPATYNPPQASPSGSQTSSSNLFGQPIDKDMDEIFAKMVPNEAQQELIHPSSSTSNLAPPQPNQQSPHTSASNLFAQPVDKDMDEIFAKMVPPQAQTEVTHPSTPSNLASPQAIQPSRQPIQQPAQAAPPAPQTNPSNLFGQAVDKDMDEIFAKMVPPEAQTEFKHPNSSASSPTPPVMKAPISEESPKNLGSESVASPSASERKLFQGGVDKQVEQLFSEITPPQAHRGVTDLASKQAPAQKHPDSANPPSEASEANIITQENPVTPELKDFGRLSNKTAEKSSSPLGTMKTIGKLLIDSQDVDNIIKKVEAGNITVNLPSARVISTVRGEGIQALLDSIDNYNGVSGSMLVGGDGLVIASTYTGGADRDTLGVLAHGLMGNSNLATLRFDLGKLDQMVLTSVVTENNTHKNIVTILTDAEVGALAVFIDSPLVVALDQLLEQLSTVARGE